MLNIDPDLQKEINTARRSLERATAALATLDGAFEARPLCFLIDQAGREWYLMERETSTVIYYTKEDDPAHYVVWDSADETKGIKR